MLNEITEFKMDKQEVPQGKDCWICFDKENYITLTNVHSEKILKNCDTYLDSQIIIKAFEKDTTMSCCSYCYESANQLILLEERLEKLQKEISSFILLFSKNVLERRSRVEKDKIESDNKSTIVVFENVSVKKEVNENVPKELLSDSQVHDVIPDLLFVTNTHESFMGDNFEIIIPEEDIDIKYSCDAAATNGFDTINKIIVPKTKNLHNDEKNENTIKTSMADLIKCLKMPIILLERIQPCKTRKPTFVVSKTSSNNNLKVNDHKNSSISTYYDCRNGDLPDPTLLPKNQENGVPTYNIPLNASVIAGGQTVKCENNNDNNKPHKCCICGQGFFKLRDLEDHDKLHNKDATTVRNLTANEIVGDTQLMCSICSKYFKTAPNLKRHQRLHSKNRPFKCSFCSKSFSFSNHAKRHEMIHTGERPYKCSFCDKSFYQSIAAKRHEMIHTGERPYKCSFCDKSFNQSSAVNKHEKIHTGDRPYKCSFCPKSFIISRELKVHETLHTGERPFKCSRCEKTFKRKSHLKGHDEKFHAGDKPYNGSSCPTSFINANDLQNREIVHTTDDTTYKCSFCPKSFEAAYRLTRHEKCHTSERRFECSVCEMTFKRNQHLKLHRERKHGNGIEEFILP